MRNKLKNGLVIRPMLIPEPSQGTLAAHFDQFVAGAFHRFDVRQVAGFPASLAELDSPPKVVRTLLQPIRDDQVPHLGYSKVEVHFVGDRFMLFRHDIAVASEISGLLPARRLHLVEIYHSVVTHCLRPARDCQLLQAMSQQQACPFVLILRIDPKGGYSCKGTDREEDLD